MTPAMRAAVESGRDIGLTISDPVLVQETNNTVVWLYPEPVIAKVATRREAAEDLQLEHAVAVELVGLDAEIAAPLRGAIPTVHETTGYVVTLWERLVEEPQVQVPEAELAGSLIRLHGEPHDGNRISTAAGIRWIDFESCCVGPLEWDLASYHPSWIRTFAMSTAS